MSTKKQILDALAEAQMREHFGENYSQNEHLNDKAMEAWRSTCRYCAKAAYKLLEPVLKDIYEQGYADAVIRQESNNPFEED